MKVCELLNVLSKDYNISLYGKDERLLYKGSVNPLCYSLYGERNVKRLELDECEVSFDIYMCPIDN